MKVLVIGRRGQVAQSLLERAQASGIEVVAAGRLQFDLSDKASVENLVAHHRPSVVVNAAAYTEVDNAEGQEAIAHAVNATGAAYVAEVCSRHKTPLIHLSTDYVFDGEKTEPYVENDMTAPLNAYGRTKLAGERLVAGACEKHLIVRTSWIYSPWGSNFVLTMLRLAEARSTLTVVDDRYGCPTYAPHLADALIAMAARATNDPSGTDWGVYHAAGQGDATWCGFARQIFKEAAVHQQQVAQVVPVPAASYPAPAIRPRNSRLDCHAMHDAFGLALPLWEAGVASCVARVAGQIPAQTASSASLVRSAE